MGLMDHKRTWRYRVRATPEQCIQQFSNAFKTGGLTRMGSWDVKRSGSGAVALYEGAGGAWAIGRALAGERAANIEAGAVGSEVRFEIENVTDGYTECSMWLANHGTQFGFTNDAGIFRRHMQGVQRHLRKLDPALHVSKD